MVHNIMDQFKKKSFIWVKQGDDEALKQVLVKYGPADVTFDASHWIY